jgi:glycosyltransferase involved in cell wall biosynthesis
VLPSAARYYRSVTDSLRIAVVGPTHPYTGGVSTHTTTLANRLIAAGHRVDMVSWKSQYPKFLRDGATHVPDDQPEVAPVPGTSYRLTWYNPFTWFLAGRRLRKHDVVIVSQITPFHAVPYAGIRMGFGRRPRAVVVAHNVIPHEESRVDRLLVSLLYRFYQHVLVHSEEQKQIAESIRKRGVTVAATRMPLPDLLYGDADAAKPAAAADGTIRLLFFGMIRRYKGLDVLLAAMARVPGSHLTVAGEFWEPLAEYTSQIEKLGIRDRVTILNGYLATPEIGETFRSVDALALPYRTGSASVNVSLGFRFHLPVLASNAGTLALDVEDGVNGIVFERDNVDALVAALTKLGSTGELARLTNGVNPFLLDEQWSAYIADLLALAAR